MRLISLWKFWLAEKLFPGRLVLVVRVNSRSLTPPYQEEISAKLKEISGYEIIFMHTDRDPRIEFMVRKPG